LNPDEIREKYEKVEDDDDDFEDNLDDMELENADALRQGALLP